jgi:chromatin remodeling complex protein RSC6
MSLSLYRALTQDADREGGIVPQRNKTTRQEKEWQRRRHDSPEKNEEEEKTSSVRRGEEKMSEAQVKRKKKKTDRHGRSDQIRSCGGQQAEIVGLKFCPR